MLKSVKFKSTAGDGCHMDVDWLMECMWAHIEHVCNTFPLGWVFRWLLRFILYAVDFMLIISCSSYACFHAHLMSTQCVTVLMNIRYADVIVNVRCMNSRISSRIRSQHLFFTTEHNCERNVGRIERFRTVYHLHCWYICFHRREYPCWQRHIHSGTHFGNR